MHTRRSAALLSFAVLWVAAAPAQGAAAEPPHPWDPGRTVEGEGYAYQLFTSQGEGEDFARYRVRGTIDAVPEALVRAFLTTVTDPARAPDGQTRRVIAKDPGGFVVHTLMDLPPLFSDRDIVTRGESSADSASGARRVDWRAIDHPGAPRTDGTIRIEHAAGFWVFAPAGEKRSNVTYENYVDLGGSLPQWLVQRIMANTVGTTYEDLAAEALGRPAS